MQSRAEEDVFAGEMIGVDERMDRTHTLCDISRSYFIGILLGLLLLLFPRDFRRDGVGMRTRVLRIEASSVSGIDLGLSCGGVLVFG